MPFINEDEFAKLLKADIKEHIFLFTGDDDYLKEFYCSKLTAKTVDESLMFFNYHSFNNISSIDCCFFHLISLFLLHFY